MNADYARQVAAECEELVEKYTDERFSTAGLHVMRALTRAAAVLHLVSGPESPQERLNGFVSVQDGKPLASQEAPTGGDSGEAVVDVGDWLLNGFGEPMNVEQLVANHRAWTEQARRRAETAEADRDSCRKRWHEAATQRDTLAQAARRVIARGGPTATALDELESVVEAIDGKENLPYASADRLRRELWHVLDRMPAGDDDLIESVKNFKAGRDQAASQRDRLLRDARAIQRAHDLEKSDEIVVELENTIVRIEHELGL